MTSTWSVDVETQVAAGRIFKAGFIDWHNVGPKLIPHIIKDVALLSGDGGPGSLRLINFVPGLPFGFVKERLEFIDHGKLEAKLTLVEGGELGTKLEFASSHVKVEAKGSGSVVKFVATYKTLPGVDFSEEVKKAKESFVETVKAVEAHLLAHPAAYA